MTARPRRSFTPEFKEEIVELCQRGDRSIGQVAKGFDLTETAVRDWVKQAEFDNAECEELARLREGVEVLKRATAFNVTFMGAFGQAANSWVRAACSASTTASCQHIFFVTRSVR
ncbi:transposase [Streptomyces nodosus]|uniref:Transposase n=1 Tax=Streptomyces nodosus TaxID=40318 RepID=A0A5P2WGB1_9ACTN|nr:transposase [Streptomyces nodosus]MBB4795434.1 hypothetical protein [Streptomyces nodosus]QEV42379.1 transposase [Streptomyces nodosus]